MTFINPYIHLVVKLKGGGVIVKFFLLIFILLFSTIHIPVQAEAHYPSYTISPISPTYGKRLMNSPTYNQYTKHYYLLRTYLEQMEKNGGGTLVLNKGTYTISNTLYVPSNVTIRLKDGVVLKKGTVTGTKEFSASKSMFQLIRPSRSKLTGVYGLYNGEKNIQFIGEGKAIIDLNFMKDSIAIIAGHNQNIVVDNIYFKNMNSGHFLEIDATKKITIKNSEFYYSKASSTLNKEAINLDTPDITTKGWSQKWSKFDKTPNQYVLIETNKFYELDRAIGTHKYSEGKYHDSVTVRNNKITLMRNDAIRVMNWSNSIIELNIITNVRGNEGHFRGILASGAINPAFRSNTFDQVARPIHFLPWKNIDSGSQYATTSNQINEKNKEELKSNKVRRVNEDFIRIFDGMTTERIPVQKVVE